MQQKRGRPLAGQPLSAACDLGSDVLVCLLQLLSTDESKPREARVARQTTKNGLYNALDIGSIWLQKANENV